MKKFLTILLFCLFVSQFAKAKDFYSDYTIQTGETWISVSIYDSPPPAAHTTVTMTGGSVTDAMGVFDAATFNISGGSVSVLVANESSTVNISGGSVGGLSIFGSATATISQSASIYSAAAYSGIINMNGGTVALLSGMENSTLNLRGGNITDGLGAYGATTINVFGYDLAKTNIGGTHGSGQVTGFWQNDLPFTINLGGSDAYSHINLIPEPATLLLFGVGTFLLRKSERRIKNVK